ncbi:MAG: hypothetical protein ACTSRR_10550 [Candidatus Heimdallarchaeaceae archaeon]
MINIKRTYKLLISLFIVLFLFNNFYNIDKNSLSCYDLTENYKTLFENINNNVQFSIALLDNHFYYIDTLQMSHFSLSNFSDEFIAISCLNTLSTSGNIIYALSDTTNEVIAFDINSTILYRWGSFGSEDGEFISPRDIEVSSDNRVFVADSSEQNIQIFNSSGSFENKIDLSPLSISPILFAVDSIKSELYIVGSGLDNNKIYKTDFSGTLIEQFNIPIGSTWGAISTIRGLFFDEENETLYVTDINNRIQLFDSSGIFLEGWGEEGVIYGNFDDPHDIFYDITKNYTFIADTNNQRMQFFDGKYYVGNIINTFPNDKDQLVNPTRFTYSIHNHLLYVIDEYNHIQIYSDWFDNDSDGMPDGYEVFYGLDSANSLDGQEDLDCDLLSNIDEFNIQTKPNNNDTDSDGIRDDYEVFNYLDPFSDDSQDDLDSDGLINILEFMLGTKAYSVDSDEDSLPDLWEYYTGTNPNEDDADDDIDGDSLSNLEEFLLGTFANTTDTDNDEIPDDYEVFNGLNASLPDSSRDLDGDQLSNLEEFYHHTNASNPDTDSDEMPDGYEVEVGLNPLVDDADHDPDSDGLTNLYEYYNSTDPLNNDTDSDKMPDGYEIQYGLNPLINDANKDADEDELTNYEEFIIGTNPKDRDSDNDGFSDYFEYKLGFSPTDKLNSPLTLIIFPSLLVVIISLLASRFWKSNSDKIKWKLCESYRSMRLRHFLYTEFLKKKQETDGETSVITYEIPKLYKDFIQKNMRLKISEEKFKLELKKLINSSTIISCSKSNQDVIEWFSPNHKIIGEILRYTVREAISQNKVGFTIIDYNKLCDGITITPEVIIKHLDYMTYIEELGVVKDESITESTKYYFKAMNDIITKNPTEPALIAEEIEEKLGCKFQEFVFQEELIEKFVKLLMRIEKSLMRIEENTSKTAKNASEIRKNISKLLIIERINTSHLLENDIEKYIKHVAKLEHYKDEENQAILTELGELLVLNYRNDENKLLKVMQKFIKIVAKEAGTQILNSILPGLGLSVVILSKLKDWINDKFE